MNDINELQNIWKSVKTEVNEKSIRAVPDNLFEKLRKLEIRQGRINRIKLIVLILIFTQLVYTLNRLNISTAAYLGLGIIFLGTGSFMYYYLKNQFNIKKLDFTANSIAFADEAIKMLEKQNEIFKVPFLIFAIVMLIGSNVMFLGLDFPGEHSFKMHILYTIFIAISAYVGYMIRIRRIKKEVLPIIRDLKELKINLSNDMV